MTPTRLLIAAALLSAGCVTDTTSTLQGEWAAFEVIPVDDGMDERAIPLPLVDDVDTNDGTEAKVTETIDASIDEENVLNLISARTWAFAGQSPVVEACEQITPLTVDEETGAFIGLLPEANLGDSSTCPEADISCTVSDDGLLLNCDVFYTDMSAAFQDTHLDGLRLSFRPADWADTGAM